MPRLLCALFSPAWACAHKRRAAGYEEINNARYEGMRRVCVCLLLCPNIWLQLKVFSALKYRWYDFWLRILAAPHAGAYVRMSVCIVSALSEKIRNYCSLNAQVIDKEPLITTAWPKVEIMSWNSAQSKQTLFCLLFLWPDFLKYAKLYR